MNRHVARVADSTPALLAALIIGAALSINWRAPWTRATAAALLGITSTLVLVWAWPR